MKPVHPLWKVPASSARRVIPLVLVATLLIIAFVPGLSRPAPVAASQDPGIIAYVRRSTHDIHVISPDGTGDRVLWTAPRPLSAYPPYELAWRPDGRELAFSSEHEEACSWYQSDVYAIGYTGTGYRRVTNSPACAALATLPKGSVAVNVVNNTSSLVQVYVQGAPGVQSVLHDGTVTLNNVADFGPGVLQPAVGIYGGYRIPASPPLADVQPNATVPGGNLIISQYSGIDAFGAGKISWKADGSALAYGMRTYSRISQISASPPYGSTGEPLPVVEHAAPKLVAWGSTAETKDYYLYFSKDDIAAPEVAGIYLNTVGDDSGGAKLVHVNILNGEMVYDIEWLPDGSGFLFSGTYINLGIWTDIFRYDFGDPPTLTRVTNLPEDQGARAFSISPDGQQVVFEWVPEIFLDRTSSLWIINSDGSGVPRRLANDAGRPAWGRVPLPPAPRITSLNPSSAAAGGPAFTLTVHGTDFVRGSVVRWNGSDRATTYANNAQLTASITAADIATAGSVRVTVFNPAPGGGTSNAVTFSIYDPALLIPRLYLPLVRRG